jgi:tetratricopeptide (TPR) repeat protein
LAYLAKLYDILACNDANKKKPMQQSPYIFRLSIHSTIPPVTDPRLVLQRADEVSAAFRMLSDAQTSTLVLTGDPGVGKSTLAALLYRNLEIAAQAGQVPVRRFVWLSLGPNATLPDVLAAILNEIEKTDAGTGGKNVEVGLAPALPSTSPIPTSPAQPTPAPTLPTPTFFMRKPQEQIRLLKHALCRPQESAFVVLDQFEELLNTDRPQAVFERGALPLFLELLQMDLGATRVLLTCSRSPFNTPNGANVRVRVNLVSRISIPEGVALLQQRGVQGTPEELSLIWQRCAGHVFGLVLFSTLCELSGFSLSYLLNSLDYVPLWNGDVTIKLISTVYNFLNPVQRTILRSLCLFSEPVPVEGIIIATTGEETTDVDTAIFQQELNVLTGLSLAQQYSYSNGIPHYYLHPLLRHLVKERYLEGNDRHLSGDLTIALGVTTEPNPIKGNPEAREVALAAGHIRVAVYYSYLAQQYCPPSQERKGPQDVEPLLAMVHHLCLGWHWQQAYDLIFYEGLDEHMIQWGAWNTLIALYTAMVPPLGVVTRIDEGQIYSRLGLLYGRLGDYQQSYFYNEQALVAQRETGELHGEAVTLTNQGEVLRSMGQTQQARVNFEQALQLIKQTYDAHLESILLHNLGLLHQNQQDYQQAFQYYQQSLKLAQRLQDHEKLGMILTNMGMLLYEQGNLQESLALFFTALKLRYSVQDRTIGTLVQFLQTLEQKIGPEEFARLRQEALSKQKEVATWVLG